MFSLLRTYHLHLSHYQFILCLLFIGTVRATCYYPSGLEPVVPGAFTPCNSNSSAVSMCCNSENGDKCTKEGLCESRSNAFYRDLCTDSTWSSPDCVKICVDDFSPRVTQCDDESWCCGPPENSTSCCDGGKGIKLAATAITTSFLLTPVTSTGSPSSTVSTSPTITSSSVIFTETTTPGSKAASGKKDNSVAIGAGVGVAGGVFLACIVGGLWYWRRKQKKKNTSKLLNRLERTDGAIETRDFHDQTKASATISKTQASPATSYESEVIEDGSVVSALATGGSGHNSTPRETTTSRGAQSHGGEIHEMESRENFHELPGSGEPKPVQYSPIEKF